MKFLSQIILVLLYSGAASATSTAGSVWLGVYPIMKIDESKQIEFQLEHRTQDGKDLILYRPHMTYRLNDKFTGGSGLDSFASTVIESRVFQEFTFHHNPAIYGFKVRYRQEIRTKENEERSAHRARLMLVLPLHKSDDLSLTLFDEWFVNQRTFTDQHPCHEILVHSREQLP